MLVVPFRRPFLLASRFSRTATTPTRPFVAVASFSSSHRSRSSGLCSFPSAREKDIDMAPKRKRTAPVASTAAAATVADGSINDNVQVKQETTNGREFNGSESPLSDVPDIEAASAAAVKAPAKKRNTKSAAAAATNDNDKKKPAKVTAPPKKAAAAEKEVGDGGDPEAEGEEEADEEEVKAALSRPPPIHSDYLPLPWKGRLGYACLNTYLRYSTPPVFSSRTCRIASILEHRHPLKDPTQPEHATKNRPDREQPADIERGRRYVEAICLANVKDVAKMIRWNERFGIKFLRLSSEMFPFASHEEYGYKLAPFAADALAEAGKVIAELGHRVTTHPGQFTQLGSPRKSVIDNAVRDLVYHDEMLSLLKLPEQANKDAVMILHMGGMFGDKEATLNRFRENYAQLPQGVKNRLVLENDDVIWSVHDLLPICEELNIPMVLDFHHHNIIFNADEVREGTADIVNLFPRIKATWDRKGIKQKMHYSEPTPPAITGRQRRKHNPRVATLPPCAQDMDLMIEAKDKEQAVFELMRTFKLPGYDTFNDIIPHVRSDDNKFALQQIEKKRAASERKKNSKKAVKDEEQDEQDESVISLIPDDEIGMGGPEGRVYWPPGMEDWLRPKKREVKPKKDPAVLTVAQKRKQKADAEAAALSAASLEDVAKDQHADEESDDATPATKKAKHALRVKAANQRNKATQLASASGEASAVIKAAAPKPAAAKPKRKQPAPKMKKEETLESTPPTSENETEGDDDDDDLALTSLESGDEPATPPPPHQQQQQQSSRPPAVKAPLRDGARRSNRTSRARISYQEDAAADDDDDDEDDDLDVHVE